MARAALTWEGFQQRFYQPLQPLAVLAGIILLFFSILALPVVAFYDNSFAEPGSPAETHAPALLCLLVIAGGALLLVAGWRFSALRLTLWQAVVIVFGIWLGLWASQPHVTYEHACCMFAYQIGQGYPFTAVTFSLLSENSLSWGQVHELMRQHPDALKQNIALPGAIADSVFYGQITLIAVVILRSGLRFVGRFARKRARGEA